MRVAILSLMVAAMAGCGVSQADVCDRGNCGAERAADAGAVGTTLVVPVTPVTNDFPRVALYASVTGTGSSSHPLYVPLALPVGTVVHSARARVRDSASSGRLTMAFMNTTDNAEGFRYTAFSPPSSGTGVEETMAVSLETTTAPSTQYFVQLFNTTALSSAVSLVYRLELDVN